MATKLRQQAPQPLEQEIFSPEASTLRQVSLTMASDNARANGSMSLTVVGPAGTVAWNVSL